ncbi:tetratricopeptide repeat protein [Chryseobacterium oryctis]|uniref:Helix-turn-helix domain-containing protein n=1 Tax=Chryseobacterium oryctis TaxID=2952618 RepID=A0ABT3HLH5_9FLAO|nr:tetratricopeptide repeat protein [Chryseobacterium oryctis]MCW3160513.1 helix-turn-helix domain-containing protein [Chryseobacterium oryctis]
MKKIYFLLFTAVFINIYSQKFNFEENYKYARALANKNPDSSEIVLNQIIDFAHKENKPTYLAKAYYLKSFNSYLKSDAKTTLDFAEKALNISEKNDYPIGKALAYRMQGTQNAKLGLLKEASENLNDALAEVNNINTDEGHELKGLIYNSFLILLNQKEYAKKEYYSKNAIQEFQKIKNTTRRNELLVSAYTNIGYTLSEVKKFDEAKIYFKNALALVGIDDNYLRATILHDLGFSLSQQNKTDSAIFYYKKALDITNKFGFNEKKIEITKNLEEAFTKQHDPDNAKKYKIEHLELKDSLAYNQKMAVDKTLTTKEKNFEKKINENNTISKGLIILCVILLISLGVFVFKLIQFNKKHKQIVSKIYEEGITPATYEEEGTQEVIEEVSINEISQPDKKISPELEESILMGLKNFEENLNFNNKNVTLYNLANELNVNTKYLSAVIKKHKNLNFNQYINYLRINYIVDKLKNEDKYRKYKINHLAEITGYSSHSAFSLEFKKIVGMHPSAFIKALDKI